MDNRRFDSLAKSLANGASRRSVLKGLLGLGGAALTGGVLLDGDSEAARRPTNPTPTPVKCPGQQTPCGSSCCCPATAPNKCGPDCCTGLRTDPYPRPPTHSECGDNECCFGTYLPEEFCCPTNLRPGNLPPTNTICDTVNGPKCCLFGEECCAVDGCCNGACYGGATGRDFCCPAGDTEICRSGGVATCCQGSTPSCCTGDSDEPPICCAAGTACCFEDGCCDGTCYGGASTPEHPIGFNSCCPAAGNACRSGGVSICCQGETPQCCSRDSDEPPVCLAADACCRDNDCAALSDPARCLRGVCDVATGACTTTSTCAPGVPCCRAQSGDPVCCTTNDCNTGGYCCEGAEVCGAECCFGTDFCCGGTTCCTGNQCNTAGVCCPGGSVACGDNCCDSTSQTCGAGGVCICRPGFGIYCEDLGTCVQGQCCVDTDCVSVNPCLTYTCDAQHQCIGSPVVCLAVDACTAPICDSNTGCPVESACAASGQTCCDDGVCRDSCDCSENSSTCADSSECCGGCCIAAFSTFDDWLKVCSDAGLSGPAAQLCAQAIVDQGYPGTCLFPNTVTFQAFPENPVTLPCFD